MKGRAGALAVEMVFVLASVIWLKEWVFPFFISQWFPQADTASQMLEWILLVIGVITCFIYVGLGSSAWNHHGLKAGPSLGVFLVIHLPLLLPVALSAVPGTGVYRCLERIDRGRSPSVQSRPLDFSPCHPGGDHLPVVSFGKEDPGDGEGAPEISRDEPWQEGVGEAVI
ncbi:hypothetical protein HMPREF9374_0480 [Desmospora sp. 8437]|nr:hypothetical protein HMPREF9374_0480 [Desmospora sp. 8437]